MRLIFSIFFLSLVFGIQAQNSSPEIVFIEDVYDFGEIPEGPKVETIFTFKNSGKSPLVITNAKGSCGCTVPIWPKEPILEGEEGEIKVVYNTARRPGSFLKTVSITSNAETAIKILKIKGTVSKEIMEETMPIKAPLLMSPNN